MATCMNVCIDAFCKGSDGIGNMVGCGFAHGVNAIAGPGAGIHTPTAEKVGKATFTIGLGAVFALSVIHICRQQARRFLATDLSTASYMRAIDLIAVPALMGVTLMTTHDAAQHATHPPRTRFLNETALPMMRSAVATFLAGNALAFLTHLAIPRQWPYVANTHWLVTILEISLLTMRTLLVGTTFQKSILAMGAIGIPTAIYTLWATS